MLIGKHTYGVENLNLHFSHNNNIQIGNFCSIAQNITIFLGGNHRHDRVTTFPFGHIHHHIFNNFDGHGHPSTKGDVIIGNDVWIGSGATIMSGIKIADGAVIAANACVVNDVTPYSIAGGNPAKIMRSSTKPTS